MLTAGGVHHQNGLTTDGVHLIRPWLTADGMLAWPLWPTRPAPYQIPRTTLRWDQVVAEGALLTARARWLAPLRRFELVYRGITRATVDDVFARFFLDVSGSAWPFLFFDPAAEVYVLCRVEGGLKVSQPMVMDYMFSVELREVM